jgi:seryl-tRNA synthetase
MSTDFLSRLEREGLVARTDAPGVLMRSPAFERLIEGLRREIRHLAPDSVETQFVAPVMDRRDFERSGYLEAFPHLAGAVVRFAGDERDHRRMVQAVAEGADWSGALTSADLVLTPAACYPLYPMLRRRGRLPEGAVKLHVECQCLRCEPSVDPFRLQSFRMVEFVCVGAGGEVEADRAHWMKVAANFAHRIGLEAAIRPATDAFFGRVGALLGARQSDDCLKYELQVRVPERAASVACASFNLHCEKFGRLFELRRPDGATAESGCTGFGLERWALALYATHGLDPRQWPAGAYALTSPEPIDQRTSHDA